MPFKHVVQFKDDHKKVFLLSRQIISLSANHEWEGNDCFLKYEFTDPQIRETVL